jgi:catechol 2,3-dioxygenase-like lactoylglutathione lyase family enzyme
MTQDFGIRIQHAGIHVKSLEETARWYHDIFGFELLPPMAAGGPFGGGVFPKMRWMKLGDFKLEVYQVQDAEPFSLVDFEFTHGVKHLSFAIRDLDGWLAYIKGRGDIEILVDNRYGGPDRAIYIVDNNGILVEVTNDELAK